MRTLSAASVVPLALVVSLAGPRSAPALTLEVGAWPYGPASAHAFDPSRSLAFVATGGIVTVLDLSTPSAPAVVSEAIRSEGLVEGVVFDPATDRLYLTAGPRGLEIWDVADITSPEKLGSLALSYFGVTVPAGPLDLSGTYACISTSWGYLHVVDVSDPTNPVDVGFNGQGGNPSTDVFVSGGQVYLGGPKLSRFLIQPDGSLQLTGQFPYNNPTQSSVFVSGGHAYTTESGDLVVFDVGTSGFPIVSVTSIGNARDVVVSGNIAYVGDGIDGVHVFDVSNPAAPVEIGTELTHGASSLLLNGTSLHVTGSYRFRVLDVSTPTAPSEVGQFVSAGSAYDVDVAGNHAYVASSARGLHVLDISDRTNPVTVGHADVDAGAVLDLSTVGDIVYAASQFAGLRVFDVQDPANPVEIAQHATPDYARGVSADGSHAYVADLSGGLRVFDVGNPAAPVEIGSLALSGSSNHVCLRGDVAYVANGDAGLSVVDVSTPAAPALIGTASSAGYTADVFVEADYAYLADFGGGLRVLDVSNPAAPAVAGTWDEPGLTIGGVTVQGGFAYLMDAGEGMFVIDVTDPASPVQVDAYDTPGNAFRVFAAEGDTFVADGVAGVRILHFGDGTTDAPVLPPAATATRVIVEHGIARFVLPDAKRALSVFDVRGRRLLDTLGRREVSFSPSGSGVYFWRVAGRDGGVETGKVVLVR